MGAFGFLAEGEHSLLGDLLGSLVTGLWSNLRGGFATLRLTHQSTINRNNNPKNILFYKLGVTSSIDLGIFVKIPHAAS